MHYVYVLKSPDGIPLYVGKGQGKRGIQHLRDCLNLKSHSASLNAEIAKVCFDGLKPILEIIFKTENEVQAFELEKQLVLSYGRKDLGTGTLCNVTNGGRGPSGIKYTPEILAKKAEANRKSILRPAVRQRLSASIKLAWANVDTRSKIVNGQRRGRTGRCLTPRQIQSLEKGRKSLQDPTRQTTIRQKMVQTKRERFLNFTERQKNASNFGTYLEEKVSTENLKQALILRSDGASYRAIGDALGLDEAVVRRAVLALDCYQVKHRKLFNDFPEWYEKTIAIIKDTKKSSGAKWHQIFQD
jgi:hypothetical protein